MAFGFLALSGLAEDLPPSALVEDQRLNRTITVHAPRLHTGELVRILSRKSGVELAARETDSAADEVVVVSATRVRVLDVMNAIAAMFSYRGREWRWETSGTGANREYILTQSVPARRLAGELEQWLQDRYEISAESMIAAAAMSPMERRVFLSSHVDDLFDGNRSLLELALSNKRKWDALSAFAGMFPKADRERIYQRELSPEVDLRSGGEAASRFASILSPGTETTNSPHTVRIRTSAALDAPVLVFDSSATGGFGYAGGFPLQQALEKRMRELWISDEERLPAPELLGRSIPNLVEKPVTVPAFAKSPGGSWVQRGANLDPSYRLERQVAALGESGNVPILARLSLISQNAYSPPTMAALGAHLDALTRSSRVMVKQHAGFVLVSAFGWFKRDERQSQVPWAAERRIRGTEDRNRGSWPLADLIAIHTLTDRQLDRLSTDHPLLQETIGLRPVLKLAARSAFDRARLLSSAGLPLTPGLVADLGSHSPLRPLVETRHILAVRLVQEQGEPHRKPAPISWQASGEDGRWWNVVTATISPTTRELP